MLQGTTEWFGHYLQVIEPGSPPEVMRFTAVLHLEGQVLTGSLKYLDSESVVPYQRFYAHNKSSYSFFQRMRIEKFIKRFPDSTVRVTSSETSTFKGTVTDSRIEFVNTYDEPTVQTFCYDGIEEMHRFHSPEIFYTGEISSTETKITGTFRIAGDYDEKRTELISGPFEMELKI